MDLPLIIAGTKIFDCQHYIDRKIIGNEKKKAKRDQKKEINYVTEFCFPSISQGQCHILDYTTST